MKDFDQHQLLIEECEKELKAFRTLLDSKKELKERDDILPFFKSNRHLSAFIGTHIGITPNLIAYEYDIFGDFTCDLAIGDSNRHSYLFIEFEDAQKNSLFVKKKGKITTEWSPRLEHGISQVIDWFYKLDDMKGTDAYNQKFKKRKAKVHGLVIVGREEMLSESDRIRLQWRQEEVVVNSNKITVLTFDELANDLEYRLVHLPKAAKVENI